MYINLPDTSTLPDQIQHDIEELQAYCDIGITGFDRDILLDKVTLLKTKINEYIEIKERE